MPNKILIFDSGVGGLSVYQEIRKLLPHSEFIYLFDNEAYPYGELPRAMLISRVNKLVIKAAHLYAVDLVVIACNTASTIVLPGLRKKLNIPIVGVVPAIKPASLISHKAVGLIATPATVEREYTHELIRNFSSDKPVQLLGTTRLVDMAEEKLCGKPVDLEELESVLLPIIGKIDVAVLGCTHFPLLKEEIQMILGSSVVLVDSGEAIARRVKSLLTGLDEQRMEERYRIYCSAALNSKAALNRVVAKLNFYPIEMLQTLGA